MPGFCYPDSDHQKGANDLKIGPSSTLSLEGKALMNTASSSHVQCNSYSENRHGSFLRARNLLDHIPAGESPGASLSQSFAPQCADPVLCSGWPRVSGIILTVLGSQGTPKWKGLLSPSSGLAKDTPKITHSIVQHFLGGSKRYSLHRCKYFIINLYWLSL